MQRDREHRPAFGAEPRHFRNDAGGRDGDAPLGQRQAVAVGQNRDRLAHGVEIVERLAHAHEDDVRHRAHAFARGREPVGRRSSAGKIAEPVARDQNLGDDLGRGQVARQQAWVPVWQKVQLRVQPTWLETHSVPRSDSGM